MPVFNWVALKPNQINGTVFNEIDDERILEVMSHLKSLSQPYQHAQMCLNLLIITCQVMTWPCKPKLA